MDKHWRNARRADRAWPEYLEPETPALGPDPAVLAEFQRSYWDCRRQLAALEAHPNEHPRAVIAYFRCVMRLLDEDYGGYVEGTDAMFWMGYPSRPTGGPLVRGGDADRETTDAVTEHFQRVHGQDASTVTDVWPGLPSHDGQNINCGRCGVKLAPGPLGRGM